MPFDSQQFEVVTDEVLRVLMEAREWLSDPKRWTKGCSARDENGDECNVSAPWVVSNCALGAVMRSTNMNGTLRAEHYLRAAVPADFRLNFQSPLVPAAQFNDAPTTTHADVLTLFDRAIAARKAECGQ